MRLGLTGVDTSTRRGVAARMIIQFAVVNQGLLEIKGGAHNNDGEEGVTKVILWFLNLSPDYAVDKMFVASHDSIMAIPHTPMDQLVEWDHRLPVRTLLITLKAKRREHVVDVLMD
jgi:hypothetical protein